MDEHNQDQNRTAVIRVYDGTDKGRYGMKQFGRESNAAIRRITSRLLHAFTASRGPIYLISRPIVSMISLYIGTSRTIRALRASGSSAVTLKPTCPNFSR